MNLLEASLCDLLNEQGSGLVTIRAEPSPNVIQFRVIHVQVMNRRQLLSMSAAGAASQLVSVDGNKAQAATHKRALMKLGCQSGPTNDQHLQFFKRHSVTH